MATVKKPWEGEKPPAPDAPIPPPPPPAPAAQPTPAVASPAASVATVPNLDGVGVDEEANQLILDTVNGDQAPLELINLVSSGVPMAEARAILGLRAPEPEEPVEDTDVQK